MKICDKCRCNSVCGCKEEYSKHYYNAQDSYDTCSPNFEVTIKCKSYIPDKRPVIHGREVRYGH